MKLMLAAAAVVLASLPAGAASPSFDCSKAKKSDEIAICKNDQLSQNDRRTTELFLQLKKKNRGEALKIARQFLERRHSCGSDIGCIGEFQDAAIADFEGALGRPSLNESQAAIAPAQPTKHVSAPNPWPDAYSRRNLQLGMSLSDFKDQPYPDPDRNPNAYSVCSNEAKANDLGYTSARLFSDAFKAAGMVLCAYFYDYQIGSGSAMVMDAGVVLGDDSVSTSFYFIPDDSGTLRLFWITTEGPSEWFMSLQQTMRKAYGEPQHRVETWQNKIGNAFDNDVLTWTSSSSQIEFKHYSSTINKFALRHTLTPLWAKLSKLLEAQDDEAAKKL